jgi:hypothetical protein
MQLPNIKFSKQDKDKWKLYWNQLINQKPLPIPSGNIFYFSFEKKKRIICA